MGRSADRLFLDAHITIRNLPWGRPVLRTHAYSARDGLGAPLDDGIRSSTGEEGRRREPMSRRREREETPFGSDSFLDVLANIVGILIILIVAAASRMGRVPDLALLTQPDPE